MTTPNTNNRGAVAALIAAFLGWLFDGFEMGLFPLIGKPALQDMLPDATAAVQGQWFTVIIAIFLVGAATGGVLFGWLGDKMGRVKAMALAIGTFAIFTGLCAFVTEAWQFAALRFIASLGMGGEWALGVALVNEIWGGKNRAWIAGMIGAASNVGFLLTGVLSLYLNASLETVSGWISSIGLSQENADYLLHNRGWRFLAVSGAAPALINFFILIFVPESHKWEEEKKSGGTSHWATKDLLGVLLGCDRRARHHHRLDAAGAGKSGERGRRAGDDHRTRDRPVGLSAPGAPLHDARTGRRQRADGRTRVHHEESADRCGTRPTAAIFSPRLPSHRFAVRGQEVPEVPADAARSRKAPASTGSRITTSSSSHPDNRFVLSNKVSFEHRSPTADDVIEVGMVDIQDGDKWIPLGKSNAWNWQQGCMLQWIPGTESKVIWNDREKDKYVSHILDVKTMEKHTLPAPIYALSSEWQGSRELRFLPRGRLPPRLRLRRHQGPLF
jgi:hypothetical protein